MAKSGVRITCVKRLLPNFTPAISEELESLKVKLNELEDRSAVKVVRMSMDLCTELMTIANNDDHEDGMVKDDDDDGTDEARHNNSGRSDDISEKINTHLGELEVLKEYIWEQFNIGHWKQVPVVWRSLYSVVSLLKVILMVHQDAASYPVCDIIKECDLGLLMGEQILDNILSKIAFRLHVESSDDSSQLNTNKLDSSLKNKEQMHPPPPDNLRVKFQNLLPNQCEEARLNIKLISKPSIENFIQEQFNPQKPAVLARTIDHWPAVSKWDLKYLRQVAGSRTVPIEIGSKYTSEEWTQKLVTMEHFIDFYIKGSNSTETTVGNIKGYLAQHQLFHQIPELMLDIRVPEYCYVGSSSNLEINAWFGPSGTISPVHYDPKHNLLAQVFGSKIIRLFPPSEWNLLYPHEADSMLFNTSQIDVEDPHLFLKFPNCRSAKYMDVLLEPGMVLYMPPKWAHYVKSLSPSFSVSFWFE